MRCPSKSRLMLDLHLDSKQALLIRRLAKAVDSPGTLHDLVERRCPKTAAYVRSMYSWPYDCPMWRETVALAAMDEVVGTFGVEALGPDIGGPTAPPYEYLNTGDTYGATLIYRRETDTLIIGSWGDIAERHPNW
jgi:hypothetical protein